MKREQILSRIEQTCGKHPTTWQTIDKGVGAGCKGKAKIGGRDYMVKLLPGNAMRIAWYRKLTGISDERVVCPSDYRLFDDGWLCLLSPWIDGRGLDDILQECGSEELQCYGAQAADILQKLHRTAAGYPGYEERLRRRVISACDKVRELTLSFPGCDCCLSFLREQMQSYRALHVGLVHGDIRPENFLVRAGRLYLIDFENGGPGEAARDFCYLTMMGGEEMYPFARAVLQQYPKQLMGVDFWKKNRLYSTLQLVEYAVWKYEKKGRQVKYQAENLMRQYDSFRRLIPLWMENS